MRKVTVVIPVYKEDLSHNETMSLENNLRVLAQHKIVVVKPRSLQSGWMADKYPELEFHSFDDEYFDGIAGYNRMMLSSQFYGRFTDTEYILICQLDAWIFRDDLLQWCDKGYDYIGAPWLPKPHYRYPLQKLWLQYRVRKARRRGIRTHMELYGRIGNGGLSLRRVADHIEALGNHPSEVEIFSRSDDNTYNEDVFWATVPSGFCYPSQAEALGFSFDMYPAYAYRLSNGKLPFGCHGWYNPDNFPFWKPIILGQ